MDKMRKSSPLYNRGKTQPIKIPSSTDNSKLRIYKDNFRDNSISSTSWNPGQQETSDAEQKRAEYRDMIQASIEREKQKELFENEVQRFVDISKYFSNPLVKTASYISENRLVAYPNPYRIEYKRGCITTGNIKFSNLILEPVFLKLYKLIPDLEQIKYINLSLSRCKRIPPGLSYSLGFVYDDVNEKPACNAKLIFVASRKTTTPCYQVVEIELKIEPQKF